MWGRPSCGCGDGCMHGSRAGGETALPFRQHSYEEGSGWTAAAHRTPRLADPVVRLTEQTPWNFERGCFACGRERESARPVVSALDWALRQNPSQSHAPGFYENSKILATVASAPGVRESGFRPTRGDLEFVSQLRVNL